MLLFWNFQIFSTKSQIQPVLQILSLRTSLSLALNSMNLAVILECTHLLSTTFVFLYFEWLRTILMKCVETDAHNPCCIYRHNKIMMAIEAYNMVTWYGCSCLLWYSYKNFRFRSVDELEKSPHGDFETPLSRLYADSLH